MGHLLLSYWEDSRQARWTEIGVLWKVRRRDYVS